MLKSPEYRSIVASANSRPLWYTLYDLTERRVEIYFYLNSGITGDGEYEEERSEALTFHVAQALEPA